MSALNAFKQGARLALQYWRVLLAALITSLLVAGLLASLPALGLLEAAHWTAIQEAADGVEAWFFIDILGTLNQAQDAQAAGDAVGGALPGGLQQGFLSLALILVLLPAAAWLPAAFLHGGALLTYAEAPQPFRGRRFLWGCWHWFGSFLALGLLEGLGLLALIVGLVLFGSLLGSLLGAWGWLVALGIAVVILWAGLGVFEMAQAQAVLAGSRNPWAALRSAVSYAVRYPAQLLGLYLLALVALLGLQALFRLGLLPRVPLDALPLAVFFQQLFVLSRLWARLLRLGGAVCLAQRTVQ